MRLDETVDIFRLQPKTKGQFWSGEQTYLSYTTIYNVYYLQVRALLKYTVYLLFTPLKNSTNNSNEATVNIRNVCSIVAVNL